MCTRLSNLALISFCLPITAVFACGGSVAGITPEGPDGGDGGIFVDGGEGGADVDATTLGIEGSYDLTFTSVDPSPQGGGPPPPGGAPPSLSTKLRLDLRKTAGGYEAVLTPRWQNAYSLAVAASPNALTLTGKASVGASAGAGSANDEWNSLVLARRADGTLTGDVQAAGKEWISEGDVIWDAALTGRGVLARDATAPELRAKVVTPSGPEDALLPWDPFVIEAAEPVDPSGVLQQTTVTGDHGESLALRWGDVPAIPESWAGAVSFLGFAKDWTKAAGNHAWKLANPGANVRDRVGLSSPALARDLAFLWIGGPTTELGFDGDVIETSNWGAYQPYGSLSGETDPRCESGGCMRLGPVAFGVCGNAHVGFAGQLLRGATGHVELRYRVLLQGQTYDQNTPPVPYSNVMVLELATLDGTRDDHPIVGSSVPFKPLATPIDGMSFGSDWATFDVAAPPSQTGPIGVAVLVGNPSDAEQACGGPLPPPVQAEILVEHVTSK